MLGNLVLIKCRTGKKSDFLAVYQAECPPIFVLEFKFYIAIERGNTVPQNKDIFLLALSSSYSWDFNEEMQKRMAEHFQQHICGSNGYWHRILVYFMHFYIHVKLKLCSYEIYTKN